MSRPKSGSDILSSVAAINPELRFRPNSVKHDVLAHSALHNFRVVLKIQAAHDPVLVKGDRLSLEIEYRGGFLHRPSLSQQLEDFDLPVGEFGAGRGEILHQREQFWNQ